MKKDIPQPKVTHLAVAVLPPPPPKDADGQPLPAPPVEDIALWDCFILNLREAPITNALISSRGYGEIDGKKKSTTTLRHFIEALPPETAFKIEPIQTALFALTNEYWVSFNYGDHMYDKKYVFVKGSIVESNFTKVPIVERKGVMIR